MSGFDLALQEQKLEALREQLALKYKQMSELWLENAKLKQRISELEDTLWEVNERY